MFYILHGEDEFGRSEALAGLRAKWAGNDPAMADLNTTTLDGARLTLGELRHACDAIPFLAAQRVVLVHGLLSRLAAGRRGKRADAGEAPAWKKEFLQGLAEYLPHLPPTTALVFVEDQGVPCLTRHPQAGPRPRRKSDRIRTAVQPAQGRRPSRLDPPPGSRQAGHNQR